jgi:heparosan-N-sulfate-glucuronate 5-epimerase
MRSFKELCYLGRDFLRYATGRDYARQPQGLGCYFRDARCYYNDLRGKSQWNGNRIDGLPAYSYATSLENVLLPIMVLQYGLGCIDCFFTTGKEEYLGDIRRVADWLLSHILADGYYNNRITERDQGNQYWSHNSSMVQGEALSFCTRAVQYRLVAPDTASELRVLMQRIFANMILPLENNGTAIRRGEDLFFCEFCRTDGCLVLNGWVFTYFGLHDYAECEQDEEARQTARATLQTMVKALPSFERADGWAYYDNKGRICSPFYQDLHIALMDALFRLTGVEAFHENMLRSIAANGVFNRVRYTVFKIRDKLLDKEAYGSAG